MTPERARKAFRTRQDFRDLWDAFSKEEAFDAGIALIMAHQRPKIILGEDAHTTCMRQAYQAGYEDAIYALRNVTKFHTPTVQNEISKEWGGPLRTQATPE